MAATLSVQLFVPPPTGNVLSEICGNVQRIMNEGFFVVISLRFGYVFDVAMMSNECGKVINGLEKQGN